MKAILTILVLTVFVNCTSSKKAALPKSYDNIIFVGSGISTTATDTLILNIDAESYPRSVVDLRPYLDTPSDTFYLDSTVIYSDGDYEITPGSGLTDTIQVKALIYTGDSLLVKQILEVRLEKFVWSTGCEDCMFFDWRPIWEHQKYLTADRKEIPTNWIIWSVK